MPDQMQAILYHGILLTEYHATHLILRLFALEGFYVEVLYNDSTSGILTVTSYPDTDGLDHFVSRIDISELNCKDN